MDNGLIALLVLLAIGVAAASWGWHFSRSRKILEQWAAANGMQIVAAEYRTLRRGPFFWTTSKGQSVYRVTVRDSFGAQRSGWVRCGSWWMGLMSEKAEARWD